MCAAVGFLASNEAAYITGVLLPVDGGLSMQSGFSLALGAVVHSSVAGILSRAYLGRP